MKKSYNSGIREKMKHFIKKAARKLRAGYLEEVSGELRWMYRYIKKYRLWVLMYIVIGIAGAGMGLGVSVASRNLIDMVLSQDPARLAGMAGTMAAMAAGSIAASAAVSRVSAKIMVDVQNEMRGEMYSRILYSRWEELQLYSTGDLLNRLNSDMGIVSRNVIGWLPSLLTKGFQFLAAFFLILYYDPTMAVLALVSAPLTLLLSRMLIRRMHRYNREMREISSDMMSFQNDSFQNLQTVKAFGLMGVFSGKMNALQEYYRERLMDYNKFNIFVSSYLSIAGTAVSYLCFGWSIYRLWGGYITVGTMAMFLQLASGLSAAFNNLVHMVPALLRAAASAGRWSRRAHGISSARFRTGLTTISANMGQGAERGRPSGSPLRARFSGTRRFFSWMRRRPPLTQRQKSRCWNRSSKVTAGNSVSLQPTGPLCCLCATGSMRSETALCERYKTLCVFLDRARSVML